jgi:phosphohistidine phosphatase
MRTLYVLRHAKSSWDDETLRDHDRPLAPRGMRVAPLIADHMRAETIVPDVVLCSTARRTRETLELLGDAIPVDCDVRFEAELYGATADAIVTRLRALPDTAERAMVIGHNPGLQRLAWLLARSGPMLSQLGRKFPTAALATLDVAIDRWPDLARDCARLDAFVRPRDLRGSR